MVTRQRKKQRNLYYIDNKRYRNGDKMKYSIYLFLLTFIFVCGCKTTYEPYRTDSIEKASEGSLVFVRPDEYSILGTRSIRDHVEISYEKLSENVSDYCVLNIGFRNRGGQHFWDLKGRDVQLSVQTKFYEEPLNGDGYASGPAKYTSNWQTVKLVRV